MTVSLAYICLCEIAREEPKSACQTQLNQMENTIPLPARMGKVSVKCLTWMMLSSEPKAMWLSWNGHSPGLEQLAWPIGKQDLHSVWDGRNNRL